jgi:hypothetical protein
MKHVLLLTVALTGCAMSNGIQKMGPDTYSVSAIAAPIRGGAAGAEITALEDANRFCASQGKEIMVKNTSSRAMNAVGAGSAMITFQCLAGGDRGLTRPTYQSAPDVVIQDNRR